MKAKLIKQELGYILFDEKGIPIGHTPNVLNNNTFSKLSLKNCQAIERGYDLEYLALEFMHSGKTIGGGDSGWIKSAFKEGFQKALEILGDKKFSEKELTMLFAYGHQIGMNDVLAIQSQHSPQPMPKTDSDKLRDELIQSLQQNEWEVEIEIVKEEYIWSQHGEGFEDQTYRDWREVPKLDADRCIILKRV